MQEITFHNHSCPIICCINRLTSLCNNLFNLLEFLAETFRCHVHHFQCLTVPVELAVMFWFIVVGQTGRSFKTRCTEYIKGLTQPLIKSNFAEHMFNTHHTCTNIETNLEILHILTKGSKLYTTKQYEIYKHYKQSPTNILNDHVH